MSVISDISSVIGLATKAMELADKAKNLELKEVIVDLKGKLIDLKEEIVDLREENAELKRRMAEAPLADAASKEKPQIRNGLYYFGSDMSTPHCPECYEEKDKKHVMARAGNLGHKCTVCGNVVYR